MAAVWSCRLIPFAELLTRNGINTLVDVQLAALSALSELPKEAVLANLLAIYFPNSSSLDDKGLHTKFQRLMAKLRSAGDPSTGQLLSVMYQIKSQKVLRQSEVVFGEGGGQFERLISFQGGEQNLLEYDFKNVEVHSQSFTVGCFLYEYDVDYFNFLDTLFAVTLLSESYKPTLSKLTPSASSLSLSRSMLSHSDTPDLAKSPLISELVQLIKPRDSTDASPCWQQILLLLHTLKEWSELAQPNHTRQQILKSHQSERKIKNKKDVRVSTAMRVNLCLELIVSCLRQEEEDEMATPPQRKEVVPGRSPRGDSVKEQTTSTLGSLTSDVLSSSISIDDQTMCVEELEGKAEGEHKGLSSRALPVPPPEGPGACQEEPDTLATAAREISDGTDGKGPGAAASIPGSDSFQLLQVPEGTLKASPSL